MRPLSDLEYISIAETKAKLSEKLRSIEKRGRRFVITSHGKPKAVLISYKEYISLSQSATPTVPKKISLDEWKKEKKKREKIIQSTSAVFDTTTLSRKGQKGYKRNVVGKMEKIKK